MKPNLHLPKPFMACSLLLLAALENGHAQVRIPVTNHDIPAYARFEAGLIHTDGDQVAIAFYRPPDCVRQDFNLLNFFDIPFVFFCTAPEPYLTGFGIWQDVPEGVDPLALGLPPNHVSMQLNPGHTMPVWFMDLAELETIMSDGDVTIAELGAMDSLKVGTATFFSETLHPLGGAVETMISVVSQGLLEDGRVFDYTAFESQGVLREVRIEFH